MTEPAAASSSNALTHLPVSEMRGVLEGGCVEGGCRHDSRHTRWHCAWFPRVIYCFVVPVEDSNRNGSMPGLGAPPKKEPQVPKGFILLTAWWGPALPSELRATENSVRSVSANFGPTEFGVKHDTFAGRWPRMAVVHTTTAFVQAIKDRCGNAFCWGRCFVGH